MLPMKDVIFSAVQYQDLYFNMMPLVDINNILQQVDIFISKNPALQMLCLKHHVYKTSQIIMENKLTNTRKLDPHKINNNTNCY